MTQCALLSRLLLKDYSLDRFKILHIDSTDTEDVKRCSFNWQNWKLSKLSNLEYVWGLGAFSTQCSLLSSLFLKDYSSDHFKISYTASTDAEYVQRRSFNWKKNENCRNIKFWKCARNQCTFCPGGFSSDHFQILYNDSTDIEDVQRCNFD